MTADEQGRPAARPRAVETTLGATAGVVPIGLDAERDGLIRIPAGYDPRRPAPLLVLLHGAGGNAERMLRRVSDHLDEAGIVVLVPESRDRTWDIIVAGDYGPDVAFIDRALDMAFHAYAIDPARVAIGGFSDGASYALSLGIMNGGVFSHVLAFSPGFMSPLDQSGKPRLFVSHGTEDEVLPIDMCSRQLAPLLHHSGYDVRYLEFPGGHAMPSPIVRDALAWFTA